MISKNEIPLIVPDIGENEKIEIVTWHVKVGDRVDAGQELCELVTEKAAFSLESPDDGNISAIYKIAGETTLPGETIATLERAIPGEP